MVKFISKLFGKRPDDDPPRDRQSTGSGEPSKKPSKNQQSGGGKPSADAKSQGKGGESQSKKNESRSDGSRGGKRRESGSSAGASGSHRETSEHSGDAPPKKRRRRRRSGSGGGRGEGGEGRRSHEDGESGGDAGQNNTRKEGGERRGDRGNRDNRNDGERRESRRDGDGGRGGRSKKSRPPREPRKSAEEHAAEAAAAHAEWDPASYDVPAEEGKTRFVDFDIPSEVLHAIADLGFQYATPIQAEILPSIIEGRDAVGQAQTGTGKTAAFLTSLFTHLMRNKPTKARKVRTPRALILAPTRELAQQIEKEARQIGKYTGLRTMAVFGGMDYVKQKRILEDGVIDVIAATPGRLIDFMRSKDVILRDVEVLVIDEADRMLDMGFIPDVRRITRATPPTEKRRTMFFSATYTGQGRDRTRVDRRRDRRPDRVHRHQ